MRNEPLLWSISAACFVAFFVLGALVSHRPPSALDQTIASWRGTELPIAIAFTRLGYTPAITAVLVLAGIAFLAARADWKPVVVLAVSQSLSQGVVAWVKPFFGRARPIEPLFRTEPDLSFPSGHATTAVVLFAGLIVLAWRELPRAAAIPVTIVLGTCVVGIPWSRLALGAHWATDVFGGLLFGTGWLCGTLALVQRVATLAANRG